MAPPNNNPQARSLRLTVVAHASPRWRAAGGASDADRRNLELSKLREQSVRAAVEQVLRQKLGPSVPIRSGVSRPDGRLAHGVEVGGYGVGSRDSLREAGGNRGNDDAVYRKVDVIFEASTTATHTGPVSLPSRRIPARIRKWWTVRVDRLYVNYVGTPSGEADLTLTNGTSNKSMRAKVDLKGSGYLVRVQPSLSPPKVIIGTLVGSVLGNVDEYGEKKGVEHPFGCNREMGFADFNGQTVTFDKKTYTLGITGHTMSLTFDTLGDEAWVVLPTLGGLGVIGVGHYTMSGPLRMVGPNPGDWVDEDPTELAFNDATRRGGFTLTLTFPSGKSRYEDLGVIDRVKLEALVAGHAERFLKSP